ncbi:BAI1-associated protein 3 [Caerostris darwini]|uniref:BAI1-associated protein 3 n=1 Tax=Caerostris darwini TaxID=1538125 RepID=A0AAV4P5Z1_9ARAC|nr:BAI1-associated protein 3 [Caerostris darwini]
MTIIIFKAGRASVTQRRELVGHERHWDCFARTNLPSEVLSIKGAVVQVLVLNEDKSYSAEAVLLLKSVQNMSGFISLEFLPVYLMPLKKFDISHIAYQILENRSRWDKNAKLFTNSRNKTARSPRTLLSCIPGKSACHF